MGRNTAFGLVLSALLASGCGKPERNPVPPAGAKDDDDRLRPEDVVEVNAEKVGPAKVGPALVSLMRVWESSLGSVPTLTVALRVGCAKESPPITLKGWAVDSELIEKLSGKPADLGTTVKPAAVNFKLLAGEKENCRGLMMFITHDPETSKQKVDASTREVKALPGSVHHLLYQFERPGKDAKELVLEVSGEDFGHTGRVRFRFPASKVVRE